MKIIHKDLDHNTIKVVPETLDDIWHLSNIIQPDNLVRAITFRTDEQATDKVRTKKSPKKKMKLGIRVEQVKFHEFSDRLRIHGIIEEGMQDLGSHHTFNVTADAHEVLTIIKENWKPYELKRLEEAVKQTSESLVLFVSLDNDEATIAVLRNSGIQWIASIESHQSGKQYQSENMEKQYFGDIIKIINEKMTEQTTLVIVGPGFTKDHLSAYGKENHPLLFDQCLLYATGNEGMNGIHEAMKSGVVEHIAKENRVVQETLIVDKVFLEIKKNGLVAYGFEDVERAIDAGAVDRLVIADSKVRTKKGDIFLQKVEEIQSDFIIVNSMHDAGKKLEGLGGIAAILRYKI
ncbi:MAG: mRNA surveillance protein pelota [Candidatus Thermoplasmatota archaeon]|nr:mRNA surveillance protein pelota [Candidatus Thermoplasmatota archaeon]